MLVRYRQLAALALACALTTAPAKAELGEIKITKQPGLLFTPMLLMKQHKLVEKHASKPACPTSRSPG